MQPRSKKERVTFYAQPELKRRIEQLAKSRRTTMQVLLERAAEIVANEKEPSLVPASHKEADMIRMILDVLRTADPKAEPFSRILESSLQIWKERQVKKPP